MRNRLPSGFLHFSCHVLSHDVTSSDKLLTPKLHVLYNTYGTPLGKAAFVISRTLRRSSTRTGSKRSGGGLVVSPNRLGWLEEPSLAAEEYIIYRHKNVRNLTYSKGWHHRGLGWFEAVVGTAVAEFVSYSNAADTDSVSPILSSAWASPSAVIVTDGDDAEVDEVVAMVEMMIHVERADETFI